MIVSASGLLDSHIHTKAAFPDSPLVAAIDIDNAVHGLHPFADDNAAVGHHTTHLTRATLFQNRTHFAGGLIYHFEDDFTTREPYFRSLFDAVEVCHGMPKRVFLYNQRPAQDLNLYSSPTGSF